MIIFAGLLTYVEQDGEARDDFGNILVELVRARDVLNGRVRRCHAEDGVGQLVTSVAILCGVLFMAMPITIVGNNFATVWEEKEAVAVVLKMQVSNGPQLLHHCPQLHRRLHRHLSAGATLAPARRAGRDPRLLRVRRGGDGALDLAEFKAALGVMDIRMPLKKVRKLFKLFDQDGNNSVDYMEVRWEPSASTCTARASSHSSFPTVLQHRLPLALGGRSAPARHCRLRLRRRRHRAAIDEEGRRRGRPTAARA